MLSSQPPYHPGAGDGEDPDRSTSASMTTTTTTTTTGSSMMTLNNSSNNNNTTSSPSSSSTLNGITTSSLHLAPPSDKDYAQRMQQIDELKYFLATANDGWACTTPIQSPPYQVHTFPLATGEHISCVLWNNLYHITGTDIVRSLVFRFHAFGRPVQNLKKFEEGVFSDLRNLKPGLDACLEEPRSEFLDMLYKNNCIRTKKKQKVFYWFSVPHDRLFLDALERDLKREKLGIETTSLAVAEPATSLSLDSTQELFDHLRKSLSLVPTVPPGSSPSSSSSSSIPAITNNTPKSGDDLVDDHDDNDTLMQNASEDAPASKNKVWLGQPQFGNDEVSRVSLDLGQSLILMQHTNHHRESTNRSTLSSPFDKSEKRMLQQHAFRPSRSLDLQMTKRIFGKLPLFDGSPTYKQRRHRAASVTQSGTTTTTTLSPLSLSPVEGDTPSKLLPKRPSSMIMTSRLAKAAIAAGYYHQHENEDQPEDDSDDYAHMTDNEDDERTSKTLISTSSYNALAKATSALASVMSDDPRARCTFTCPLHACGRLFRRLEQLKRHLRTHTLHRPHLCQTCGKRFSRSDNLAQHKKVHQRAQVHSAVDIHAAGFENSNSDISTYIDPLHGDDLLPPAPLDKPYYQLADDTILMEGPCVPLTVTTTGPMMDFSFMEGGSSLNSSLCNSPVIDGFAHLPYQKQPNHYKPSSYHYFSSAASSIVPSPSSSTSSPYGGAGSSTLTQDYHYQLQQQQMQALQQALTSCMKPSSSPTTYQRPGQVPHRWSYPETTSSSLLTSPFIPPFMSNDQTDEDWTQWPTAMDLNDLDAFASTS